MKKTKRFFAALLAALTLAGAMATGAMAAALKPMTETGTVTINNALAGTTYTFYRVFDLSGVTGSGAEMEWCCQKSWRCLR